MKAFVAVTDGRWYRYLAAHSSLTEANFWLPSGGPASFGLAPGEPLLFKTKAEDGNHLVGGGFLSDYRRLPISLAWQAFGNANGCSSEAEMRELIQRYRSGKQYVDDPVIGCVMLRDTAYFPPSAVLPEPSGWSGNIVTYKGYELGASAPWQVEAAFGRLVGLAPTGLTEADVTWIRDGPMYGPEGSVAPRLGQGAFAAVVGDAYRLRCAITGAKVRPALQAAHIRPVARQGQHRVDNGLLLRADVHIMFDEGYLGVHPERRTLQVSRQIRETFGNGQEFYSLHDAAIAVPERRADQPNAEFLQWHMDEVFQS